MNRFKESKLLFWTVEVLLLVILFFVLYKVNFIFYPVRVVISTLVPPIIIALFLYYLFNPIVTRLAKMNVPKPLAVLMILLGIIILFVVIIVRGIPEIISQTNQLVNNFPGFIEGANRHLTPLLENFYWDNTDVQSYLEQLDATVLTMVRSAVTSFFRGVGSFAGSIWSAVVVVITVPVVLFYLYKDGALLFENVMRITPQKYSCFLRSVLLKIHHTLRAYITGQAIICSYVAISLFICYTIVGIPYAFVLGIFAGVMDIIPYAGPWIAASPALIIAFSISPITAVIIAIAIIVIQLGESYIVSPLVMGKSLHLHPIIIIFVLLIAGKLGGLVGMILGIPIFATIKVIFEESLRYLKKEKTANSIT